MKAEQPTISLDDLQEQTEKLLHLLKDRQPGLMTWHQFMSERINCIYRMLATIQDNWISVDTPPEVDGVYWVYMSDGSQRQNELFCGMWVVDEDDADITHWQPLPAEPKTKL